MIWLVIAIGVVVAVALSVLAAARRSDGAASDASTGDVDPLFVTGIALTGAGVALALTVTGAMFVLMVVGLIVMAIGAARTRHAGHPRG